MEILKCLEKIRRAYLNRQRRLDEDDGDGHWVTTENGHKIFIDGNGAVTKGNPMVIAGMGKPKGVDIPKRKADVKEIKEHRPYEKGTEDHRAALGEAIAKREDKHVIFGGFYKVAQDASGIFRRGVFFNPYTGDYFIERVDDADDDRVYYDPFYSELREMPIHEEVADLWRRLKNQVRSGDKIRVVKGRTIPHGTEAKVRKVYPFRDKYKRYITDYAYLDNGQKINVANIEIID